MPITEADRSAIIELHHRYYLSTDDKDVEGFMDCWVEDGFEGFFSPFGDFETRDALSEFEHDHTHGGTADGKRHFSGNLVMREGDDADTVLATSYMTVVDVVNVPKIVATGKYTDSVVRRTSDGWKFARRELSVDPGYQKLQEEQED